MYLLATSVARIACSPTTAFAYAADLENFQHWFPGVISIAACNELPYAAPGKQYVETVAVPLRGRRGVLIQVIDVDAPHRIVTEGDLPLLLPRMEIEFQETSTGSCEVRWRMFSRNDSVLIRCTLLPLARCVMRRRALTGLHNLKVRLEGSAPAGSVVNKDAEAPRRTDD